MNFALLSCSNEDQSPQPIISPQQVWEHKTALQVWQMSARCTGMATITLSYNSVPMGNINCSIICHSPMATHLLSCARKYQQDTYSTHFYPVCCKRGAGGEGCTGCHGGGCSPSAEGELAMSIHALAFRLPLSVPRLPLALANAVCKHKAAQADTEAVESNVEGMR